MPSQYPHHQSEWILCARALTWPPLYFHSGSNGAHINNKLSNSSSKPVPDTADQIQTYLTELAKYVKHPISQEVFDARILHTVWVGINPIISIWRSTSLVNQTLHSDSFLTPELVKKLDAQVSEVSKQLKLLLDNPSLSKSVLILSSWKPICTLSGVITKLVSHDFMACCANIGSNLIT